MCTWIVKVECGWWFVVRSYVERFVMDDSHLIRIIPQPWPDGRYIVFIWRVVPICNVPKGILCQENPLTDTVWKCKVTWIKQGSHLKQKDTKSLSDNIIWYYIKHVTSMSLIGDIGKERIKGDLPIFNEIHFKEHMSPVVIFTLNCDFQKCVTAWQTTARQMLLYCSQVTIK